MVFYEGVKSRKNELNPNLHNCVKYTVKAFEDHQTEIEFFKESN